MLNLRNQSPKTFFTNKARLVNNPIQSFVRGRSVVVQNKQLPVVEHDPIINVLSQSFSMTAQKRYRVKKIVLPPLVSTIARFSKEKYFKVQETQRQQKDSQRIIPDADNLNSPAPIQFLPYNISVVPPKKFDYHEPFKLGIQNIEMIMLDLVKIIYINEQNFDFQDRINKYTYLPLTYFADSNFDQLTDDQIKIRIKKEQHLNGQIMIPSDIGRWEWHKARLIGYDDVYNKCFLFQTQNQKGQCQRISFLLDFEDPYKYLDKLDQAFNLRKQMDGLLRYNYYIQNMKDEDLECISQVQQQRIIQLINLPHTNEFKHVESLLIEIQKEYLQAQNQIIFNKYLHDEGQDLIIQQNIVVPLIKKKVTSQYGKLPLEQHKGVDVKIKSINQNGDIEHLKIISFKEIVNQFNTLSLYSSKEVLCAITKIKAISNDILNVELYYFRQKHISKSEDFKNTLESIAHKALNVVRQDWMNNVVIITKQELRIINKKSQVISSQMLDRFFQMLRMLLQDILLAFVTKNLRRMCNFFQSNMPQYVIVKDSSEVKNVYVQKVDLDNEDNKDFDQFMFYDPQEEKFSQQVNPIFSISIILSPQGDDFVFSYPVKIFQQNILNIMDKSLDDLATISDPEPRILDNYFKFSNQAYLKAPKRPLINPHDISHDPKKLAFEENQWLWDLWQKINSVFDSFIDPLQQYLQQYEFYKDILKQQIVDVEAKLDENANGQNEIDRIRQPNQIDQVFKYFDKRKDIPQEITIGIFLVSLSDTVKLLKKKLESLIQVLMDKLIRKVRITTVLVINEFQVINEKLREVPKNIEQLQQIKDYMDNDIPLEIQRKKEQIRSCLYACDILEEFQYNFRSDDVQKRWQMIGMPNNTMILVQKIKENFNFQRSQLSKQKNQLQDDFIVSAEQIETEFQFRKYNKNESLLKS